MIKRDHTTPPGIARRAVLGRVAAAIAVGAAGNVAAIVGTRAAPLLGDIADARAMLARAEQAIEVLRTCVVCEGWHGNGLNEEAASRTLQYLRRIAAGAPEDDQEWEAACAFFYDHGQSLDWIVMGNPGGMICGAAARSPRAASLIDDPIFAAIDARKRAMATFEVEAARQNAIDEARRGPSGELPADLFEMERKISELCDINCDTARDMLRTIPTTTAGAAALLSYVIDCENSGDEVLRLIMGDDAPKEEEVWEQEGCKALLDALLSFLSASTAAVQS
jgi:hypothetical protein